MNMKDETASAENYTAHKKDEPANPSEVVDLVVDVTKNLGSAFGREARAMAGRVSEQLSETVEAGVERGADALGSFVRAMHAAAQEVEPEAPGLARTLDDVARNVDGFADTIRGRTISELVSSAAKLARRNPTIFLAGTILAGFAVSRFVRSSAPATNTNEG